MLVFWHHVLVIGFETLPLLRQESAPKNWRPLREFEKSLERRFTYLISPAISLLSTDMTLPELMTVDCKPPVLW
jgi:hypothetical protein